jgi:spore maturation protein CgeB
MRFVLFYHSLVSDWNHGNAHFLRGVARDLLARGHEVAVYEPADGWSRESLLREHGALGLSRFRRAYPELRSTTYDLSTLDLDRVLAGADVVLVHEWNDAELVRRLGEKRRRARSWRLLFHDTHHRAVTDPKSLAALDLAHYDGALVFGDAVRDVYERRGWANAWTWHEAADVTVFRPVRGAKTSDLVWVGNWGDEERSEELQEFLIRPVAELGLDCRVHGVRYPAEARERLREAGIDYAGWLPNVEVPRAFGAARLTVHVPRRPYTRALPGVPTIRVFEALACGIPLVCSPWEDAEALFRPGRDYLVAKDGVAMTRLLRELINDPAMRYELARNGRSRVLSAHTCTHRVDQLLAILASLGAGRPEPLRKKARAATLGSPAALGSAS